MVPSSSSQKRKSQLRIFGLIQAILAGSIAGNLRSDRFLKELGLNSAHDLPIQRLSERLASFYGDEFLERWVLHPYSKPCSGWPALYLNESWPYVDPGMELLLAAMLPSDARQRVWVQQPARHVRHKRKAVHRLDRSVMRLLLSGKSLKRIAREAGLRIWEICSIWAAYPNLRKRTHATRQRHRNRMLRRRDRNRLLRANP